MTFVLEPNSPNPEDWSVVKPILTNAESELRSLLPELPEEVSIYMNKSGIIPEEGVGGFAYSPHILNLSIDTGFPDKERHVKSIKGTLFHEALHLVQGHTEFETHAHYSSVLDAAIYEGAAGVFEKKHTDASVPYGDYSAHSDEQLEEWRDAISRINKEDYWQNKDNVWERWAFYDPRDQQRWKLYKVGTWIVERYLGDHADIDIADTRLYSASDYLPTK